VTVSLGSTISGKGVGWSIAKEGAIFNL